MATNSDGGIVLSISIDSSEVSSDMKKVVSEINKQVQAEAKNLKAVESVNQAKEKTAQEQQKTEQEVYKTLQAESQALTAEQNLTTAKERTAAASAKTVQEEEKVHQQIAKTQVAEQQLQQAVNATAVSEEKIAQAAAKTKQEQNQALASEQRLLQAKKKTKQEQQKLKQETIKTKKEAVKLKQEEQKLKKEKAKTKREQQNFTKETKKANSSQLSLKKSVTSTAKALKALASAVAFGYISRQLVSFSKEASETASEVESYLTRIAMLYGESAQSVYDWIKENSNALGMSQTVAFEAAMNYGNIFATFGSTMSENAELTTQMLQATAAIASKTGNTYEATFEKIRSGLYGNTKAIDDLGISTRQAQLELTDAYKTVTQGKKKWDDLTDAEIQQIRTLGILEQAYELYGDDVLQTTLLVRNQFSAAWADFKTTWGKAVNLILMPVLKVLTEIINKVTNAIKALLTVFGKATSITAVATGKVSSDTEDVADNIEEATENQKGLNKEVKKTLASFDSLEILQDNSSDSEGTSNDVVGNSASHYAEDTGVGTITDEMEVDEAKADEIKATVLTLISDVSKALSYGLTVIGVIMMCLGNIPMGLGLILAGVLAGELGKITELEGDEDVDAKITEVLGTLKEKVAELLFVIGVILLLFGQILLGIGAMVIGATLYSIKEMDGEFDELSMEQKLAVIEEAVGAALFVIGVILLLFGQILLGIGAMVIGATLYGLGEEKLKEGEIATGIQKFLAENAMLIVGVAVALVVIGVILCLSGLIPLGVGLIVAGAIVLGEEMKENGDEILEKIEKFLEENSGLIVGVAVALVVIGVILCLSGLIPLGVGLIVAGAAAIGTEMALNGEKVKEEITNFLTENAALIVGIASAMLVLGIILLVMGVSFPIGIALIVAGAGILVAESPIVFGLIVDKVKEIWEKIKTYWDENIAKFFTKKYWLDLAKKIGNGFLEGVEGMANGAITMFENMINSILTHLNELSLDIPDWIPVIGGKKLGFDFSKVSLPRVTLPRLAQGAVIPANSEFLAVLGDQKRGTNIEAPAALIKQMAREAIEESGMASTEQMISFLKTCFGTVCNINVEAVNAVNATNERLVGIGKHLEEMKTTSESTHESINNIGQAVVSTIVNSAEQSGVINNAILAKISEDVEQDSLRTQQTVAAVANAANVVSENVSNDLQAVQSKLENLKDSIASSARTTVITKGELAKAVYNLAQQGQKSVGKSLIT